MNGLFETALSVGVFLLGAAGCSPRAGAPRQPAAGSARQVQQSLRARFFVFDVRTKTRGPEVGTAELAKGKLTINVTDTKLRRILNEPYPRRGYDRNGNFGFISEPPGSYPHLRSIAIECPAFGYTCEIY